MARRTEFQDFAEGLVSRFISRNHDIDGFWGIGVLSRAVHDAGQTQWSLDVLGTGDAFDHGSAAWLASRMEATKIRATWLESASLVATFTPLVSDPAGVWWWKPQFSRLRFPRWRVPSYHVTVTATLRDDHGRAWAASAETWCRQHNPRGEVGAHLLRPRSRRAGRAARGAD